MSYPRGDALVPDPMVRAGRLEIHKARWWTADDTVRFGGG